MLVLSRKEETGNNGLGTIIIGEGDSAVVCTVLAIHGNRVTIGIEAPKEVKIMRGELQPCLQGDGK